MKNKILIGKIFILVTILLLVLSLHLLSNETAYQINMYYFGYITETYCFGLISNLNLLYDITLYLIIGLGFILLYLIIKTQLDE